MLDEGAEIRRNVRPPDTIDRIRGPIIGLGIVIALMLFTYRAAVESPAGGPMPDAHGRGYFLQVICYAFARILGVRGTIVAGSLAAATQLLLIARGFRQPSALPTHVARTDVVHAFTGVRRRGRAIDFVQMVSGLGVAGLALLVSSDALVAPVEAAGFLASCAVLVTSGVVRNRIWKCPACGGWPGTRRATTCATCGRPIT